MHAWMHACMHTQALLERLYERRVASPPSLPVLPHERRTPSGARGLSLAALEGVRRFYEQHDGLDLLMADVCKREGFEASVVSLTRASGLSLAETLELEGVAAGVSTADIIGLASDFFSYSWTGTQLSDMLGAIADTAATLSRSGEVRVWIDMFAASQNLLAGAFRDDAAHPRGSAGYAARKEQTDQIFDDALLAVRSVFFYCSPLTDEWVAPRHGFLSPERAERGVEHPWRRRGPAAISRARPARLACSLAVPRRSSAPARPPRRPAVRASVCAHTVRRWGCAAWSQTPWCGAHVCRCVVPLRADDSARCWARAARGAQPR